MTDRLPRALLVEDDPVSAAFLEAALARVPLAVDVAHRCSEARSLAAVHTYDLLVFDANLPDGRGDDLLAELRARHATPAIAHTAARELDEHDRLLGAGFLEVLVKPLSTAQTIAAAQRALGRHVTPETTVAADRSLPLWDDASALQAMLGDRGHLVALRSLFRPELEGVGAALSTSIANGDREAVHGTLHRLRASCGFVGAARLGDAAARLSTQDVTAGWPTFEAVLQTTIDQFPDG